jgi:peptidoglycan/LPS O-acetylase OafA/YrhL
VSGTASPSPMPPSPPSRLAFLDVVRGAAASAVVVQHGLERLYPGYLEWSLHHLNLGATGVAAFFLVSGFIIPFSLERSGSVRAFAIGRFFRLFPLYWTSLLAAIALHALGLLPIPGAERVGLTRLLLANATMFQEAFRTPHAIGVYWTLAVEMIFYGLCAGLFWLGWNRRSLLWAWTALGALTVATTVGALVFHRDLPAGRLGLLVTAFVGTVVCRVHEGQVPARRLAPLLAATALGLGLCFELHFDRLASATRALDWSFAAVSTSWLLAYGAFFAAYALRTRRFPGALRWLGKASYSLYLVHPLVLDLIPRVGPAPLQLVTICALSVALAAATYRWIEQPSIALGKRLTAR